MPHMCWVVTVSTALAAMAASTALPPAASTSIPAREARASTVHTIEVPAWRSGSPHGAAVLTARSMSCPDRRIPPGPAGDVV